jgi:hypothetical protein
MRGGLKCARFGSDQLNRSARPRREFNFFFFLFSALASTTKSPLTPSRPPAQYTCGQISPSQPPSLRSFPFVFVFLFLAMTFSPVDVSCMRTGHIPFRVSHKYWKSHNPLIVNPITIDAVIVFGLPT